MDRKGRGLKTLKSMPTVAIKLQLKKVSSLKRTKRQVLPTPLSPISIILKVQSYSSWLVMLCCSENKEFDTNDWFFRCILLFLLYLRRIYLSWHLSIDYLFMTKNKDNYFFLLSKFKIYGLFLILCKA